MLRTGGFAVINNNDIIGGVRRVMEDQSYYLLAYEPEEATFDATKLRYNRIIVKVDRPDAVVRYRSGFFNVASEDVKRPVRSNDMTPQQLVGKALTSPFALSEIDISLNALYANDGTRGNYLKPLLYINAGDLDFIKDESGKFSTEIGIIVANMDANGVIAEESGKSFTISLDENAYKRAIEQGFVYHLVFPVKKPGAYQMRVAIVDLRSRKVGSASQFIQVPDPKKKGRPSISGIVLQNFTPKEWAALPSVTQGSADPMRDTSIRRFKRGSVLQYGYEVYQAALNGAKQPMINTRVRLFKDGVLKFEGEAKMIDTKVQSDLQRLKSGGAISLAEQMEVGEYVLQIVVKDEVAKAKYATATSSFNLKLLNELSPVPIRIKGDQ